MKNHSNNQKAIVLLSGGLDSSTTLYWAQSQGYNCEALSIFYGQRHKREMVSARAVAKKAGARYREIKIDLPWIKISSLIDNKKKLPNVSLSQIGKGLIPSTYVPGRNTIFLSLAVSLADATKAQAIIIGANALDYSGYPDCRPNYLKAFSRVALLGTKSGSMGLSIKIIAPLLRLDKKEIVRLALKLKVPLELTWSCYSGAKRACGRCDSCKLRSKGFLAAGISDPANS
jgi:7-cyano-7-deazaguanine synthase